MTEIWARRVLIGMMIVSVLLTLSNTFVEQDIFMTLVSISSFFTFRFLLRNPKMMMASSYEEFGKLADTAKGKSSLAGSPLYFLTVFICVFYILVF